MRVVSRFPKLVSVCGNKVSSHCGNKKMMRVHLRGLHSRYSGLCSGLISPNVPEKNAFIKHDCSWVQRVRYVSNQKKESDEIKQNLSKTGKEQQNSVESPDETFMSIQTRNQIQSLLEQAQSIPNIITLTRIASTPLLSYFIINNQYDVAIFGCILAGISDYADGYIAKNYNGATVLGTYLDPFADKFFINGLAISLTAVGVIPIWCCLTWLGRDVLLIGMSYRMVAFASEATGHAVMDPGKTPLKIEPSAISKLNTVLQFGTLSLGMGAAALYGGNVADVGVWEIGVGDSVVGMNLVESISLITCGTTVWSGMGYLDGKSVTKSGNTSSNIAKSATKTSNVDSPDDR